MGGLRNHGQQGRSIPEGYGEQEGCTSSSRTAVCPRTGAGIISAKPLLSESLTRTRCRVHH